MSVEKCKRCGKCCRIMDFPFPPGKPSKDFIRWAKFHEKTKIVKQRDGYWIRFELKCSKLKNGRCSIYKNRPELCKEYSCSEKGFPKP